jgi:UDP-N-acetylmuramoyl-tripeptide--D-alanyl-D-alanine ligase
VTGARLRLTLQWVAEATSGRIAAGDPAREIGPVVIDSRTLGRGDFFVALRGERFDGHDFVGDAEARGAIGALVDEGASGVAVGAKRLPGSFCLVRVRETTAALQDLARAVRAAVETRVVAITGSAGKTTTKEAIASFLSPQLRVVRNRGNLNNHIGLPLSLLQLRDAPDAAVMEFGMNHAGEISTLVGIADPGVRVWTNVGDAHLGFFESPDAIADAKAEILEGASADDVLVCNADDSRLCARVGGFAGRTVTFGSGPDATVSASAIEDLGIDGTRARVTTPAGTQVVETSLLGRGNLGNVLAATAVALEFGISVDEIAGAASTLAPPARRGVVHRLPSGVTLVDDSYNSSPAALRVALDVLAVEMRMTRKVAVLGEMLELGESAIRLHEACGRAVQAAGVRLLITVGGQAARALGAAAVSAGMPASAVRWLPSSDQAAAVAPDLVRLGDLVLVKGSRGTGMDVVADRIAEEFT